MNQPLQPEPSQQTRTFWSLAVGLVSGLLIQIMLTLWSIEKLLRTMSEVKP